MKIYIYISILILFLIWLSFLWWYFSYNYIRKVDYNHYLISSQRQKKNREYKKNELLKKNIILYTKIRNYRKKINLNLYKDYFVINWNYCDIDNRFFSWLNYELNKKNIIFKPKITSITKFKVIFWKRIKLNDLKLKICNSLKNNNIDYISINLENYTYSPNELKNLKNYKLVWEYKIKIYYKTHKESLLNGKKIIDKISNRLIAPWETISVMDILLNNWWTDLFKSNILKNWKIIQWTWWWACLGATVIYRTLLNAWITILSHKSHNIYYKNIYWQQKIGLDSTIYYDNKYYVDLLFKNNYKNPIIFIPEYTDKYITLKVYSKEKEFNIHLIPVDLKNKDLIKWIYVMKDKNNNEILMKILVAKYDLIDDY